jgi:hypothetical protein
LASDAADCSGWTSLGADAQAEKIARVEREAIEMQLKIRDLFKLVLLLIEFLTSSGRTICYLNLPLLAPSRKISELFFGKSLGTHRFQRAVSVEDLSIGIRRHEL